ncbi:hypothetical protein ACNFCK_22000 [Pseudomonas sp. NY15366]
MGEKDKAVSPNEAIAKESLSAVDGKVFFLERDGMLLESRIGQLEARIQASVDLTDDLVAVAANTVSVTEGRLDKTLHHADVVLDQAYFMVSTFLVIASAVIAMVGVIVTWFLSRHRNQMLKGAIDDIARKIQKDEDFKREFVAALVSHEELRDNINYAIDRVAEEFRRENEAANLAPRVDKLKGQLDSGSEVAQGKGLIYRAKEFSNNLKFYWRRFDG